MITLNYEMKNQSEIVNIFNYTYYINTLVINKNLSIKTSSIMWSYTEEIVFA